MKLKPEVEMEIEAEADEQWSRLRIMRKVWTWLEGFTAGARWGYGRGVAAMLPSRTYDLQNRIREPKVSETTRENGVYTAFFWLEGQK